jgi:hypothetical protein
MKILHITGYFEIQYDNLAHMRELANHLQILRLPLSSHDKD